MADNEKGEVFTINSLDELKSEGPIVTIDPNDDAWSFGAPPPRGVYDLKLFQQSPELKVGYTKKGDESSMWIGINLECHVVNNEEYDDARVYDMVTTRMFRGKDISTMAAVFLKSGYKLPNLTISCKKLASLMVQVLKKEPIVKAEIDWRGSYKWTTPKGEDKWENVANHYEDFPLDPKGGRKHVYEITGKTGQKIEIKANPKVARYFGKNEALPTFNNGNALVSAPRLVPVSNVAVVPELQLAAMVGGGPTIIPNVANVVNDANDELLMLQD